MKPEGNRAHARDYRVETIPHARAAHFIREHHYARGCANTSVGAFGIHREGALVGAALWMPPTRVCAESVDKARWKEILSLSRLAVAASEPTNTESIFIGAMLRALRKEKRWFAAVTFADLSQGHRGTIYRATNWKYVGQTKPEPRWEDESARQVSRKRATKSRTNADMTGLGYRMVGKFSKHKFVFFF